MLQIKLQVITTLGDMAGLPPGTRIATNHNKLLVLDEFAGDRYYWFEQGELTPYAPLLEWLPVIVLPQTVDFLGQVARDAKAARPTVCELRVEDL
jgi:hypothetical protein